MIDLTLFRGVMAYLHPKDSILTVTLTSPDQEAKGVLREHPRCIAEIPCFALTHLLDVSASVFKKCLD